MPPRVGQILIYKLSQKDAEMIAARRTVVNGVGGARIYYGIPVGESYEFPLVVVRAWPNEGGSGIPSVNGQVLLDGNDTLWVKSVQQGTAPGTWRVGD